jgi:hypothetical protein
MSNSKGNPRRLWEVNYLDDNSDGLCHEDHTNDPKVIADIEWLRFIHAFNKIWKDEPTNPFVDSYDNPKKRLVLNHYHDFSVEGHVYPYCEEYWLEKPNSTSKDALIFAIYLDNAGQKANVTCFDSDYVEVCEQAYYQVQLDFERDAK